MGIRKVKIEGKDSILRTDKDIPITYVAIGSLLLILPAYFFFESILLSSGISLTTGIIISVSIFVTVLAFAFSALGASISYMCGVIGSSNNPISGIILMAIVLLSLCLLIVLGTQVDFSINADAALSAAGVTVIVGAAVGCAAAVGGDNLQDLKSGQLVGATPWKQQLMLILGVVVSALTWPHFSAFI